MDSKSKQNLPAPCTSTHVSLCGKKVKSCLYHIIVYLLILFSKTQATLTVVISCTSNQEIAACESLSF